MPTAPTKIAALLVSNLATFFLALLLGIAICFLFLRSSPRKPPLLTDAPATIASTADLPPQPNPAVAAVVRQIKSIMDETNKAIEALPPGPDKINSTLSAFSRGTQQLREIDTSNCPADFQLACLANCQARESYVASMPTGNLSFLVGLGVHFLAGERDAGFSKASDAVDARITHMRDAMNELELSALRHGAKL